MTQRVVHNDQVGLLTQRNDKQIKTILQNLEETSNNYFVNIMVMCTPNYKRKNIVGAVNKPISIVDQFIVLYNSIIKNWTFDYRISLLHTLNFNESDLNKLENLDIDMFKVNPDIPEYPALKFACRGKCYSIETKIKGTHRLVLDCDMIALKNPDFNYETDFQAMYCGSTISIKPAQIRYVCERFGFELPKEKFNGNSKLFEVYHMTNKKVLYPYFNNGCIFVKEEIASQIENIWVPTLILKQSNEWDNIPKHLRNPHFIGQFTMALTLLKLSENWEPLPKGCNYLGKVLDINKFGQENISLYHYCGTGGLQFALKNFKEYFEVL